jgi:predicted PurR-regulated permease PerM
MPATSYGSARLSVLSFLNMLPDISQHITTKIPHIKLVTTIIQIYFVLFLFYYLSIPSSKVTQFLEHLIPKFPHSLMNDASEVSDFDCRIQIMVF